MLRLTFGMLLSLFLVGAAATIFAMKFIAIEPGADLPPKYDDRGKKFDELADQIDCSAPSSRCIYVE